MLNRYNFSLLITVFSLVFFMQCSTATNQENEVFKPIPILLDTDIGNDIDDVLALQILLNAHKENKVNIIGITISKSNLSAIQYLDAYCRYNKLDSIPIGYVYDGANHDDGKYLKGTLNEIIRDEILFKDLSRITKDVPEGYKLMRELLANSEDSTVVILSIGPQTNLKRLIESKSDSISPMNGINLVQKKVSYLSLMAGVFDMDTIFTEWNIEQDILAAQTVYEKWTTPIISSGWEVGNNLLFPYTAFEEMEGIESHPLFISYGLFGQVPYDRPSWDLSSVLYVVENEKKYFQLSPPGVISVDLDGISSYKQAANGQHFYLMVSDSLKSELVESMKNQVIKQLNIN